MCVERMGIRRERMGIRLERMGIRLEVVGIRRERMRIRREGAKRRRGIEAAGGATGAWAGTRLSPSTRETSMGVGGLAGVRRVLCMELRGGTSKDNSRLSYRVRCQMFRLALHVWRTCVQMLVGPDRR
eukprot:6179501-Pleurochrysis_carterae.AAC.4